MPSTDVRTEVAVALVYQGSAVHGYLSDALRDLGASVVYETETGKFNRPALDRSGAQVVIVDLDPDSDEELEAIDDLLVDDKLKVVFNDGEATSKLSGYDLARWARHLASKIVGDAELLPPRPVGAEAVSVRSMPQHGLSSTNKPKSMDAPSVSDESMRQATDAIADALASFDMHTTKLEAKNTPASDSSLEALLGDFGFSTTSSSDSENPFADLGLSMDLPDVASSPAVPSAAPRETDTFATLDFESATPAATDSSGSVVADELLAFADFDFDKLTPEKPAEAVTGLDDFLAQHAPRAETAKPAPAPKSAASTAPPLSTPSSRPSLLEGLTLSLEPEDAEPVAAAPAAAAPSAPAPAIDFPFDLDGLSLEPFDDTPPAAAPTPAPAAAAKAPPELKPVVPESNPFADLGLELEPLDAGADAPAPSAPAPTARAAVPPAPAPAAAAAAESTSSFFDGLDFSLDDLPGSTAEAAGKAAPAEAAGPSFDSDDLTFTLEDTVELSFDSLQNPGSSGGSSAEEDEFMREFAAMTADAPVSAATTAPSGPLARVWVLGASIGGPDAVREFLAAMPKTINAVFLLAQHMGADFVDLMVGQLQKATRLVVEVPTSGSMAAHGQVLVVPVAERMLLEPSGEVRVVALDDVSPYSPSIDRVLIDVADRFGANSGAIIFSGMAHDAIEGAKHMAAKGGTIWVQDPSTCVVSSMIDGAMEAGIVGHIGTPADLAAEFVRRFGKA